MRLTEEQWTLLARRVQHAMVESAPGWTESAAHDPGITLLQALDYALDQLQLRRPGLDAQGRRLAARVAERALTLAQRPLDDGDCGPGLQRVRYAAGMVLTPEDFQADQDYFRSRLRRRNRLVHGTGVVSGLAVHVEPSATGGRVVVEPGLAFDAMGNEIDVEEPGVLWLPASGDVQLVLLRHVEWPCRPTTTAAAEPDPDAVQATRTVETFAVDCAAAADAKAVAIARVRNVRGQWRLDKSFRPKRAGSAAR
jgi:hypothetical protein